MYLANIRRRKEYEKKRIYIIELLAVIVVLAIIALIATPIVMNVIKDAQKGAAERSAERYVDAVETAIAADRLENDMIKDGIYTVDASGNLVLGDKTLTVAVSGDKPASGSKVAIKNGQVVLEKTRITVGDYTVTINDNGSATAKANGPVTLCKAIAPTEEYLYQGIGCEEECFQWCEDTECEWDDELEEEVCVDVGCHDECSIQCSEYKALPTIVGVQATKADLYAPGTVYSCDLGDGPRTFYVLKEDGDNVKLILNENLGKTLSWCDLNGENSNHNICDGNAVKPYLASQTSEWTKLSPEQIILPSYDDMVPVAEQPWIRVNLSDTNPEFPRGYWISTRYGGPNDVHPVFEVSYGKFGGNHVAIEDRYGVRPVIVISKKELSL